MPTNVVLRTARRTRGVTLIMVSGVLVVLAALGAGFYTMMISQAKTAVRYSDIVRAELMARAGIEDAIARLREQAYFKTEDPTDPWYTIDFLHGAAKRVSFPALNTKALPGASKEFSFSRALSNTASTDSDRYILNVSDAGGRININACDNLGILLDNLCRVIGPPMVAADLDLIQPARWAAEGASGADYSKNANDNFANLDIYHVLDENGDGKDDISGLPVRKADGTAIYGDGFAIAAYRSRHGLFKSIYDVKFALTAVPNPSHPELEDVEREIKFNAIRDYITLDSWVDTNTVCVGKFEWVNSGGLSKKYIDPNYTGVIASNKSVKTGLCQILIDRDKSWVADDPANDPLNTRGSLRGSYVSIMNGHGSGQLRRIATNGADWIAIEMSAKMYVEPGPISSYMITAREEAQTDSTVTPYGKVSFPRLNANGQMVADPDINYATHPLCIHRAPININTASEKVLTALFMGINVQHGHPMAVGTDADLIQTKNSWYYTNGNGEYVDPHRREDRVLKPAGLKRVPASSGKLIINRPKPWPGADNLAFDYIANFGNLGAPNFKTSSSAGGSVNEAHELAYRVIMARQRSLDPNTGVAVAANKRDPDPTTYDAATGFAGYERGPFRSWDDFYFRVVKPWDDIRSYPVGDKVPNAGKQNTPGQGKMSVARMIMAHFNSNTDLLKFNPNIEWIDRWGRNFTEMEPVMIYTNTPESNQSPGGGISGMGHGNPRPTIANPVDDTSIPLFAVEFVAGRIALGVAGEQPNRQGSYIVRSFRYKSDEMIDKSDLNRSTTEFSFDSNGIYDISSIGRVVKDGEVLAERRIDSLVKVYDVWRESTQRQFVNGTFSEAATQGLTFAGDAAHASGTIARDGNAKNADGSKRLALNTQPEPLVPIRYSLAKTSGRKNSEIVDTMCRDAYGNQRSNPYGGGGSDTEVPDILANRVLPAGYDGQIVLATNMLSYDESKNGDWDTFLASFNGDLDTNTSVGNGREQAKTPNNSKIRVVDTIGLLGLLNDTELDNDTSITGRPYNPGDPPESTAFVKTYDFVNVSIAMVGLDTRPIGNGRTPYWQNAQVRMGDLRTDGVFLGGPGAGGNDATLKYLVGQASKGPDAHENFQLNDNEGTTISMWAKTTWHHDDNRTHEFFNASNPGVNSRSEACYIMKDGRVKWAGLTGTTFGLSDAGSRNNDLGFGYESRNSRSGDWSDADFPVYLHGGYTGVPDSRLRQYSGVMEQKQLNPEAAAYRIQPFRWHYLGGKINYGRTKTDFADKYRIPRPAAEGGPAGSPGAVKEGYLDGNRDSNAKSDSIDIAFQAAYYLRPFIDSERYPEKENFAPTDGMVKSNIPDTLKRKYWGAWQLQGATPWASPAASGDWFDYEYGATPTPPAYEHPQGGIGQAAIWPWAEGASRAAAGPRVFSINNMNMGDPSNPTSDAINNGNFYDIYRHIMEDGTYAVIDEFKISNRANMTGVKGTPNRVLREMTTSRYYLPSSASSYANQPAFTSQTLLESLKGAGASVTASDKVTVARVNWTVFTPRFMHENKDATGSGYTRKNQNITDDGSNPTAFVTVTIPYRGPFDYDIYNDDDLSVSPLGDADDNGRKKRHVSVNRPAPYEYTDAVNPDGQPHSTRGVEIEILNGTGTLSGASEHHRGYGDFYNVSAFVNPDVENRVGSPTAPAVVETSKLRYRVRFKYPIDPLVDPKAGKGSSVDLGKQYLLDTPVFDDISITYYSKPRILQYRLVNE